ncbi:MAG TPA: hypothetical protein VHC67_03620 [Gaiellaceae bacterium]|jgi:hypothetical protein|nr:hypothetical protein [Gaiellaceae bacterium]
MKPVLIIATAVATIALLVPAASAAPARHDSFCGQARSISRYLTTTLKATSPGSTATPAKLKLAYTTVLNARGALIGSAPKTLKPSLRTAFSFIALVKADFEKADWQLQNMTQYFPALIAKAQADQKPIAKVEAYLRGTCHVQA